MSSKCYFWQRLRLRAKQERNFMGWSIVLSNWWVLRFSACVYLFTFSLLILYISRSGYFLPSSIGHSESLFPISNPIGLLVDLERNIICSYLKSFWDYFKAFWSRFGWNNYNWILIKLIKVISVSNKYDFVFTEEYKIRTDLDDSILQGEFEVTNIKV